FTTIGTAMGDTRLLQRLPQGFSTLPGLGGADIEQQYGELLATKPHAHVQRSPCGLPDQCTNTLQRHVSGVVTVAVVVGLEMVDVAEQQRHGFALALRLAPQTLELPIETA